MLSPDLRVSDGIFVSLPVLRSIRGNAITLSHFVPLLRDVCWDTFRELDIATNVSEGPDDSTIHTFDVGSSIDVIRLLVFNGAEVENLVIMFPPMVDSFSLFFGENPEMHDIWHTFKVNKLRIQLRCDAECDNGKILVSNSLHETRSNGLTYDLT